MGRQRDKGAKAQAGRIRGRVNPTLFPEGAWHPPAPRRASQVLNLPNKLLGLQKSAGWLLTHQVCVSKLQCRVRNGCPPMPPQKPTPASGFPPTWPLGKGEPVCTMGLHATT